MIEHIKMMHIPNYGIISFKEKRSICNFHVNRVNNLLIYIHINGGELVKKSWLPRTVGKFQV